jgi:hypothetical protein
MQIKFRFDKYFDVPDRNFFAYLARKKNIPDFEAIRWYNEFAANLRNTIRLELVFEAFAPPYELYPPVKAERVIRADAKHSILVGDKEKTNYEMTELLSDDTYVEKESWWIYALILAAIGLSILFFHFYSNNMKWTSGNRQRVEVIQAPALFQHA